MKSQITLVTIVLMILVSSSQAGDWPQWQGPNRDGKSADTGLLQAWPEDGPPLAWRVGELGGGDSAPAVADGKLFIMSNRDDKQVVLALSEKDGSEIWVTPLGPVVEQRASQSKEGPGCTPTVDGDRLYVEGMGGHVACLQVKDGRIMWQVSMTEVFGGRAPMWSSGGALVCLDFKTGEVMWDQREAAGRRAKGSLALADGRLYYRMEDGTMLLIEPTPAEYRERGRIEQPDRRRPPAWAHPVIANGKLYVRDQDILFSYDVKAN